MPHYYSYFDDVLPKEIQSMLLFYIQKKASIRETEKTSLLHEMNEFKRNAVIVNRDCVVVFLLVFLLFQFMVSGSFYLIKNNIFFLYQMVVGRNTIPKIA